MEPEDRPDYKTRFKGQGKGLKHRSPTLTVRVSEQIYELVRAIPGNQDWLRAAIAEKLQRDGLLPGGEQTEA